MARKNNKTAEIETGFDMNALSALLETSTAELETSAEELAAAEDARKSDEELLAQLEAAEEAANEDQAEDEDDTEEETAELDEVEHVEGDLDLMTEAVSADDVVAMAATVKFAFEDRADAERRKNPDNESIQKSLNKSRSKIAGNAAVAVLVATAIDPDFINRSISQGNSYNVYAIDKFADIMSGLTGSGLKNAINIAVMKSMFKFRAAGVEFTGEMAKAAASQNIKVSASLNGLLTRHTVSPSTAPTQASSTMQALQTAGVVINKGSQKYPLYQLTDTPQTRKLQEVLAA